MNIVKTIVCFMLLKCVYSVRENLFRSIDSNANPIASKCIQNVVQKTFPCGTLVTLINSRGEIDVLLENLGNDSCYSFIVRRFTNHNWLISSKLYILVANNVLEFVTGMSELTADIFWNPKAHNIIALEHTEDNDIEKVFDVLLRFNAFSAILIRRLSKDVVAMYTYFPFNGTNCGLRYDYEYIGNCENANRTSYFSNKSLSLRNCNVTVVANKDVPNFIYEEQNTSDNGNLPGLEQYLLDTIAEKEGFDVSYILVNKELTFGVVLPNNTATGLLNFLQRDEVDIAAGGIILIKNRMDLFDFIWGYNYASFNLFTPAMGEEIWKDVYKEFSLKTWILIILAYCSVTVICIIVQRWQSKLLNNRIYLSLKLWGYLYANTCKVILKEKKMRIVMVFWIWFTFFICNFYNTALYSLLTGRDQIKRVIDVDDLDQLPFEPCISESSRAYFQFGMNKTLPAGRDITDCKYINTALDYVAFGHNAYAIEMEYMYTLSEHRYLDEDGLSTMEAWKFSTGNVIVMFLTRGFPMTQEFQDYAWKMYEAGILKHHMKLLHNKNYAQKQPHKRHFKKIVLADLRIHFLILVVGSMIAMLCFLIELFWPRK